MNETPFKKIFWIKETKNYTKSKTLGVGSYITVQVQKLYKMETKLEYLLDSGTFLNMFKIQKCQNKLSQIDGYLFAF